MASLNFSIPHSLSQQEALNRIKGLFTNLRQQQKDKISDVEEIWSGTTGRFQFTVQGNHISGEINVQPNCIDISADVPFMISLFQGQIKKVIEEQAKQVL